MTQLCFLKVTQARSGIRNRIWSRRILIAAEQWECENCDSDFHLARMLPRRHTRKQIIQLCGSLKEGPSIRIE